MTGLGGFLRRPLRERERRSAFAIAAVVLLVAAGVLASTDTGSHHATAPGPAPTTATAPPPPAPAAPSADAGGRRDALRAARRFLHGYLPYLYGHARARAIGGAVPALRRQLVRHPPRVTPATRRRHPRVVRLAGHPLGGARWAVTATIADGGVATYPIELVTAGRPAVVTRLAGE